MKIFYIFAFCFLVILDAHSATIGERYVGVRYVNNPLGEGRGVDPDPLIRTDAFDCTTFVETALADGDINKLTKIRYKNGVVNFENRNHFTETDWLPNNSDIVSDVTSKYGRTAVRRVKIDRANWLKKNYNVESRTARQNVNLNYIPYRTVEKINNTEPLVVLFIGDKYKNDNSIGTDLAVMHMGFLLPDGTLRHASSEHGRVVDTDFYEYVANRQKSPHNLGIMLLEIKK